MLFATKRAQLNTNTDISYLTTRVREPDQINCLKMVNPLNYVRGTNDIPLILSTDKNRMHKCHIDVSYAVHPNMGGHIWGGPTMGKGFPTLISSKQNINTRSSAESEFLDLTN